MADIEELPTLLYDEGVTVFGESPVGDNHFAIPNETISEIACGREHCVIVCKSGKVYAMGDNSRHQCGLNKAIHGDTVRWLVQLTSLSSYKIVHVACGDYCSFFVAAGGESFACGSNDCGQLAMGHTDSCAKPTPTDFEAVKSVSAAVSHCAVLTEKNGVFVCGDNSFGQLGLGHYKNVARFTAVWGTAEPIAKVSCGVDFIVLLSAAGSVYTTDSRLLGRVGLGLRPNRFHLVPMASPVADVACGSWHAVLLATDGSVWGFGWNHFGQLGNDATGNYHTPVPCVLPSRVTVATVAAGRNSSGLITSEGDVWGWGEGRNGGLSGKPVDRQTRPTKVNKSLGVNVLQVVFTVDCTMFLCESKLREKLSLAASCLARLEQTVLSSLECPVCLKVMCTPIHQCKIGHSLCTFCKDQLTACPVCRGSFSETRNYSLEVLSEASVLPCTQCSARVLVPQLEEHYATCPWKKRACPVEPDCIWRGTADRIVGHVSAYHSGHLWEGTPQVFTYDTASEFVNFRAWLVRNRVFFFYWSYNLVSDKIHAAAKLIGAYPETANLKLKAKFLGVNGNATLKTSDVGVDADSVADIFQRSCACLTTSYKNSVQVSIFERENICKR